MNINELLQSHHCSCGKTHCCDIEYVYIEKDAANRLTHICGSFQNILLVADDNTFAAAGQKVIEALHEKHIEKLVFSGAEILIPDESAIDTVNNHLNDIDLIIAIGSGVIQDLCKYVSHQQNIPYMVVATAPSMDGYASNGAAMIAGGMKVTYPAGLPRAIIADTAVLANAPMNMIQAGYGDIVGKFSALNDWKLSQIVNNEYFCQYIYDVTYDQIQRTLQLAPGLLQRNEESIQALMEALVVIGIMMSFAGSSRPASGSEHHLSHFFEITGIIDGTDYFSHGIDVAYSTVITAQIRQNILNGIFPNQIYRCSTQMLEQSIQAVYKEVADGCLQLQKKIGNYDADRAPVYLENETEIRKVLQQMPTPDEIIKMLSLVGLNIDEFYALYGKEKINNAILFAKDLKDRYTVLWMNYDFYGGNQNVQ